MILFMRNSLSHLLKSCAFSAAFIGTSASADTYKLEIKQEANAVLRFCVENIDKKSHDVLGIQPSGGIYNLLGRGCGDIIDELCVGTGVEFKIGSFAVRYDGTNKRIKLSGGCAEDSLILYQCACGIFIENGTELKPNTLIVRKSESASFKNEGIIEAFITYFEDCKSVENKGNFTSRNLFLIRTDIQNYGMISWCDAYHNIDGNVKNLVGDNGKNGFIKTGKKTGNTYILKERNMCFGYIPFFLFGSSKEVSVSIGNNPPYDAIYLMKRNGYYAIVVTGRIDSDPNNSIYSIGDGKDFVNNSSSRELSELPLVSSHCGSQQQKGFLFMTRHNIQNGSILLRPLYKTDAHKWASSRYFCAIDDENRALYFIYDNPNDHQTAQ